MGHHAPGGPGSGSSVADPGPGPPSDRASPAADATAVSPAWVPSGWWNDFGDAQLSDQVAFGLAQNLDIAATLSRIAAAEAATRATGLNAQLDGSLTGQSTRAGGDAVATATTDIGSLSASYVLDIFGKVGLAQTRARAALQ